MSTRGSPEVAVEVCAKCGSLSLESRRFCAVCGSRDVRLGATQGTGIVWSVTTVHRPPAGADSDALYDIAIIALAAGPHVMVRVPGGLRIGDPVKVQRSDLASMTTFASAGVDDASLLDSKQ